MATTRRTTKKAAPEKAEDIAEVDTNDIPGLSEDDTEETTSEDVNDATEDNEDDTEEEQDDRSPLDIETDRIPDVPGDDDNYIKLTAKRIVPVVLELRECNSIILRNTLSDAGIEEYAETSDDEEIVTIRKGMVDLADQIADLESKLETLRDDYEAEKEELLTLARQGLEKDIDIDKKEGAKTRKARAASKFDRYAKNLRGELDKENPAHNPMWEWIDGHQKLVSGGLAPTATKTTNGNGGSNRDASSRVRAEKIRTWAKNNGVNVNERGRIPAHVIQKYEEATGDVATS